MGDDEESDTCSPNLRGDTKLDLHVKGQKSDIY
jgi:hypothetical protein